MIVTEYFKTREDGVILMRTYSDRNVMIENKEGELFVDAIDPDDSERTYTETDIPIE